MKKAEPVRLLAGAVPVAQPVETVRDNLLLIGDAARHVDPITGGGLTHCLEGGKIAGEVIGKAVKQKDFSQEFLSEYETRWKEAFGQKIKRNYLVKELLLDMDDKTLNHLAHALKDKKFDESIISELIKLHNFLIFLNARVFHSKEHLIYK